MISIVIEIVTPFLDEPLLTNILTVFAYRAFFTLRRPIYDDAMYGFPIGASTVFACSPLP